MATPTPTPTLAPTPTPTLWSLPLPIATPTTSTPFSPTPAPMPTPSKQHVSIWRVDYNAMVEKDAAMGWQGLGYVLMINTVMFTIAFVVFQRYARSTRFSLYNFRTSVMSFAASASAAAPTFTLRKWVTLLWRTPIQGTDVEARLGPEGTFYLVYQVYTLRFLLALSVYALVLLIPLYLSVGANLVTDVSAAAHGANTNMTRLAAPTPVPVPSPMPSARNETAKPVENKWWSFAHATIRSLPNDSPYLWVPVATCYVFTAAFMVLFHHLSSLASIPHVSNHEAAPPSTARSDASIDSLASAADNSHAPPTTPEPQQRPAEQSEETPLLLPPSSEASESETSGSTTALPAAVVKSPVKEKTAKATPAKAPRSTRPHLTGMQPSALSLRSVFVDRGLPKSLREERLLFLLQEVFPGYMEDVCVVYNLSEFYSYQGTRMQKEAKFEREKLLFQQQQRGEPISWSLRLLPGSLKFPYLHRILRAWFCCGQQPFDEQAMQAKIKELKQAEDNALERVLKQVNGAGRAFLIFKSARLRARFVRRVRNTSVASMLAKFPDQELPRLKRYVRELGITRWHLSAAPEPDDIDWHSVSFPMVKRTAVVVIVNLVILALLLAFTSPVAVTSAISSSSSYSNTAAKSLSDFVSSVSDMVEDFSPQMAKMMVSYIPTLILVMINAVLLNVLQIAGRIQPITTDSAKERMILRMSAVYLIFNTIFVPSLAFVSIDAVLLYLRSDGQVLDMLGTLFLHNSGIFYVNYVLQRCFLGTAVNLLRVSEYAKFCWEKPRAVTSQEHVDSVEAWPFFTGTMSAIQISMLTIVMTFSTVVPLIIPIGALYFAMQHAVDKYSLLYVRPRIKGRGSIARTATHATVFSLLIYQGAMGGFFLVRGTKMQSSSVLILLMGTYIVTLWWYIRDKERANSQTRKGHHVHGPHCKSNRNKRRQQAEEAAKLAEEAAVEMLQVKVHQVPGSANESTALLKSSTDAPVTTGSQKRKSVVDEESDQYRAPALRKYGKSAATNRAAALHARRSSYGTWAHAQEVNASLMLSSENGVRGTGGGGTPKSTASHAV